MLILHLRTAWQWREQLLANKCTYHVLHHTSLPYSTLLSLTPFPPWVEQTKFTKNQSRVKELIVLALGHKLMEKKLNLVNYAVNHFLVNSPTDSCSQNLSCSFGRFLLPLRICFTKTQRVIVTIWWLLNYGFTFWQQLYWDIIHIPYTSHFKCTELSGF